MAHRASIVSIRAPCANLCPHHAAAPGRVQYIGTHVLQSCVNDDVVGGVECSGVPKKRCRRLNGFAYDTTHYQLDKLEIQLGRQTSSSHSTIRILLLLSPTLHNWLDSCVRLVAVTPHLSALIRLGHSTACGVTSRTPPSSCRNHFAPAADKARLSDHRHRLGHRRVNSSIRRLRRRCLGIRIRSSQTAISRAATAAALTVGASMGVAVSIAASTATVRRTRRGSSATCR